MTIKDPVVEHLRLIFDTERERAAPKARLAAIEPAWNRLNVLINEKRIGRKKAGRYFDQLVALLSRQGWARDLSKIERTIAKFEAHS